MPTEELQFTQRTVETGAKFKGPPRFTWKDSPNLVFVKGGSFLDKSRIPDVQLNSLNPGEADMPWSLWPGSPK